MIVDTSFTFNASYAFMLLCPYILLYLKFATFPNFQPNSKTISPKNSISSTA